MRKLGEATQRNYIRAAKLLSEFLGRSPSTATAEDLRRFQVHQSGTGARPPVRNSTVPALRFFFRVTPDRPEMARHLTLVRQPRKPPSVLNEEEVVRLLGPGAYPTVATGRHPKPSQASPCKWAAVWQLGIESRRKERRPDRSGSPANRCAGSWAPRG